MHTWIKVFYIFGLAVVCMAFVFFLKISVNAAPTQHSNSTHIEDSEQETTGGPTSHSDSTHIQNATHNSFDYLSNASSGGDGEKVLIGLGATVYQMLLRIGIYGVVIALVLCGISFLVKGDDSRERGELKSWLLRIRIVPIIMTSLTSIAGLIGTLFSGVL